MIAGYPWFGDWGRDTFIALRGLLPRDAGVSTTRGRSSIDWAGVVSAKACCRIASPTAAATPEYNSVDASLWFVIAVHEFLARAARGARLLRERAAARGRIDAIVDGYTRRHALSASACDDDGLLAAACPACS